MKMKFFIFSIGMLFFAPYLLKSQILSPKDVEKCATPKFEDECVGVFPATDYLYLSSWDYRSDESLDIKFAVILKRNILYAFNICEGSGKDDMVLNLVDEDNKPVLTSINKKTKKNDKIIYFRPTVTGKFYISTLFDKDDKNCCLILLGMIKKDSYIDKFITGQ